MRNSYKLLLLITEKEIEAINAYLISNNKRECVGGVGGGEEGGDQQKRKCVTRTCNGKRGPDGKEWVCGKIAIRFELVLVLLLLFFSTKGVTTHAYWTGIHSTR